jgi:hypothetical protein
MRCLMIISHSLSRMLADPAGLRVQVGRGGDDVGELVSVSVATWGAPAAMELALAFEFLQQVGLEVRARSDFRFRTRVQCRVMIVGLTAEK